MEGASETVTAAPGQRDIGSSASMTGLVFAPAAASASPAAAVGTARRFGVDRNVLPSPLDMHTLRTACAAVQTPAGSRRFSAKHYRLYDAVPGRWGLDDRLTTLGAQLYAPEVLRRPEGCPGQARQTCRDIAGGYSGSERDRQALEQHRVARRFARAPSLHVGCLSAQGGVPRHLC